MTRHSPGWLDGCNSDCARPLVAGASDRLVYRTSYLGDYRDWRGPVATSAMLTNSGCLDAFAWKDGPGLGRCRTPGLSYRVFVHGTGQHTFQRSPTPGADVQLAVAEREMLKGVTLKRKLRNYGRRLVTLLPARPIQLWWFHHPDISAWIVLPLMLAAMYALDFALSRLGWREQPTPLHQEPPPEITRYTNPRYSKS